MKNYKVALIGCGRRAPDHLEPYRFLPNARVVACSSRSDEAREAFASHHHLRAYRDPREMILKEKPDLVHIITGPEARVSLLSLVSDLNVPMATVEKPLAVSVKDYFALRTLSQSTKTKIGVCHQFRYQPDFLTLQKALQSGTLGKLKFLDISSGMNIVGQGTHVLNYGRALANDSLVRRVQGSVSQWDEMDTGHPAPESSSSHLEFENGVRALWTSGGLAPKVGDPKTLWQHVRCEGYAEQGSVTWEEFGKFHVRGGEVGLRCEGTFQDKEGYDQKKILAQKGFHQAMFDWFEGGQEPGMSFSQSLHEVAVVFALYQSALEIKIITLDQFEPRSDLIEKLRSLQGHRVNK